MEADVGRRHCQDPLLILKMRTGRRFQVSETCNFIRTVSEGGR